MGASAGEGDRLKPRVVVGVTGATGALYAVKLLGRLRETGNETHLVVTAAGLISAHHELGLARKDLEALADVSYNPADVGARIASGSLVTQAMVVVPCSMKSLAAIALGLSDNLVTRAADVTLVLRVSAEVALSQLRRALRRQGQRRQRRASHEEEVRGDGHGEQRGVDRFGEQSEQGRQHA